jgi:hypothetical protein
MDAQAMRRGAALLAVLLSLVATNGMARPAAPQLVYRVDTVTAEIVKNKLVVDASGAAQTGGWLHARLRPKPAKKHSVKEAPVLILEFVADPPKPKQVVIEELIPMKTRLTTGLPHYGTVAVEIVSKTNEITTQIIR